MLMEVGVIGILSKHKGEEEFLEDPTVGTPQLQVKLEIKM